MRRSETSSLKLTIYWAPEVASSPFRSWRCIRHFINEKGAEAEMCPKWFLGSLLVTRQSAIDECFPLILVTVQKVFAKVDSAQFLLVFKVVNMAVLNLPDLYSGASDNELVSK